MANIKFKLVINEPIEISKRVEELYWNGLNYREALRKAKEEYSKKNGI